MIKITIDREKKRAIILDENGTGIGELEITDVDEAIDFIREICDALAFPPTPTRVQLFDGDLKKEEW